MAKGAAKRYYYYYCCYYSYSNNNNSNNDLLNETEKQRNKFFQKLKGTLLGAKSERGEGLRGLDLNTE